MEEAPTFRATVDVVVAPAVVTDKEGSYIHGLRPEDFQLTDNGKAQDIKVDVTFVPISLVVAVQRNSSVESILPKIKKIGPLFQGMVVGEAGEVAVVSFDHRVEVKQDFTSDGDKINKALDDLRPGSQSSRMIDAVLLSARMLSKRPENRRRIILLISETRDRGSEARVRDALTAAQMANVSIYPVDVSRLMTTLLGKPQPPRPDPIPVGGRALPAGVPITPSGSAQITGNPSNSGNVVPLIIEIFQQVKAIFVDNPAEVFAEWTGGKEHSFVTQRDLETAVMAIGQELHSQYIISYNPNNKDEGGFHEILVSVVRPGYRDANVRTRPGYWIAARPQ